MRCKNSDAKYSIDDLLCDVHDMWSTVDSARMMGERYPVLLVMPGGRPPTVAPPVPAKGAKKITLAQVRAAKRKADRAAARQDGPRWCVIGGYLIVGEPDETFSTVLVRLHNAWTNRVRYEMSRWYAALDVARILPGVPTLQTSWIHENERQELDDTALDIGRLIAAHSPRQISDKSIFLAEESTARLAAMSTAQEFAFSRTIRSQHGTDIQPDKQWRVGHSGTEDYPSPTLLEALKTYRADRRVGASAYVNRLAEFVTT